MSPQLPLGQGKRAFLGRTIAAGAFGALRDFSGFHESLCKPLNLGHQLGAALPTPLPWSYSAQASPLAQCRAIAGRPAIPREAAIAVTAIEHHVLHPGGLGSGAM
jgi:hypothetical protein